MNSFSKFLILGSSFFYSTKSNVSLQEQLKSSASEELMESYDRFLKIYFTFKYSTNMISLRDIIFLARRLSTFLEEEDLITHKVPRIHSWLFVLIGWLRKSSLLESHAEWNLRICQLLEMGHYGHKKALGRKKAPSIEGALEIKQFQKNTTLAVAFVYWLFKCRLEWVDN